MFISYEIYDRARKMWLFNTGECLIEVTAWEGLTVLALWYFVATERHGHNDTNFLCEQ